MYYFIVALILFSLIYGIEVKRVKAFDDSNNFLNSFKNNFSVFKLICISLMFVSFFLFVIVKLESEGFISSSKEVVDLSFLPYIIYTILVVPFVEEYFFRFLPFSFKRVNNIFLYILVIVFSSVIFSYFHSVELFQSVLIFIMGVVLSLIYLKTRNIGYTVFTHSLYNLVMNMRMFFVINSYWFLVIFVIFLLFLVYKSRKK